MHTIRKRFTWEAAHRLIQNYPDKCKNLHGHSYVAILELRLRPGKSLDEFGFIVDFGKLKPFKDWIDNNLDHTTIVSNQDRGLVKHLEDMSSKMFILPYPNSTAEYIAEFLFNKAQELFSNDNYFVSSLQINETCTSEATYSEG